MKHCRYSELTYVCRCDLRRLHQCSRQRRCKSMEPAASPSPAVLGKDQTPLKRQQTNVMRRDFTVCRKRQRPADVRSHPLPSPARRPTPHPRRRPIRAPVRLLDRMTQAMADRAAHLRPKSRVPEGARLRRGRPNGPVRPRQCPIGSGAMPRYLRPARPAEPLARVRC